MAVKQRDIVLMSKNKSGEHTVDLPITRLENITDEAAVKEKPEEGDYIPVMDSADGGQMKKFLYTPFGVSGLVPEARESLILPENVDPDKIVNKNYLKNWNFSNCSNTSGATKWEGTADIVNGWSAKVPGGYTQLTENYLHVKTYNASTTKGAAKGEIYQNIDLMPLLGKTVTFSCLVSLIKGNYSDTPTIAIRLFTSNGSQISVSNSALFKALITSSSTPQQKNTVVNGKTLAAYTVDFAEEISEDVWSNYFSESKQLQVDFYVQSLNTSSKHDGGSGYFYACKVETSEEQTLAYKDVEVNEWVINISSTEGENRNLNDFTGLNGEICTYKLTEKNFSPFLNAPTEASDTNGILTVFNYSGESAADPELKCKQVFDAVTDGKTFTRFHNAGGWTNWTER